MKKSICLLFSLIVMAVMVLSSCSTPVTIEPSPVEDFSFELVDGEVTITGYNGTALDIVIPETIENRPVTIIGEGAFEKYDMNSIRLPDSLVTVEADAFKYCKKIKEISFPNGVKEVKGQHTFYECENLETVHVPDSIEEFDDNLGTTLWYKNQEDGVLYVDNVCIGFKGKDDPRTVEIREGTKRIIHLFQGYKSEATGATDKMSLSNVIIPKSVDYIAPEAIGYYKEQIYYYGVKENTYANKKIKIHGYSGTVAETYAEQNGFTFVDLYSDNNNSDDSNIDIDGYYVAVNTPVETTLTINGDSATGTTDGQINRYFIVNKKTNTLIDQEGDMYHYELNGNNLSIKTESGQELLFERQN